MSYFFFQRKNSARIVKFRLEGVLPSRISDIVRALRKVAKSESESGFSFRTFTDVFASPRVGGAKLFGKNSPGEGKVLLEILEKIHLGASAGKIRKSMIIESLARNTRGLYGLARREGLKDNLLLTELERYMNKTVAIMSFLYEISSLEALTAAQTLTDNAGNDTAPERYFESHPYLFQDPAKRWAFLIGVATRKLVEFQLDERRSEGVGRGHSPFLSTVGDMNFDSKRLRALYKAVIEKFGAYDESFKYFQQRVSYISELIADYSDSESRVSNDELSYLFALGFASGRKF